MKEHPRHSLNAAFTNPLRFSLMATLAGVDPMTFKDIRDFLDTTDSTLSKHASALEERGYVKIKKGFLGKRPQTKLCLTTDGMLAWQEHVAALKKIAG